MKRILILLLLGTLSVSGLNSCSEIHQQRHDQKKRARQLEREKADREEEDAEAYRAARERQVKIQSRETRREMKRNQRLSMRYNARKREFFLVRWFKRRDYERNRQAGSRQ